MLTSATLVPHLPSTDLARSKAFYEETLGLTVRIADDHHLAFDVGGTTLFLYPRPEPSKADHTAAGFFVDDIRSVVAQLTERGVTFERYDGFDQDALGISSMGPNGPKAAWFKDPDGHILSVNQLPDGGESPGA